MLLREDLMALKNAFPSGNTAASLPIKFPLGLVGSWESIASSWSRWYSGCPSNARLMGVAPTGNGRRESYAHVPMQRMTNNFMRGGEDDPAELLSRVKDGIYAKSFGGGQVDIVSGKFVFSCTEAYRVKDGRIGDPIKGATLIGDGPTAMGKIIGIGNDLALDEGIGMCGKGGQSVPAGVGQPTLLIDGLTVGGTATA